MEREIRKATAADTRDLALFCYMAGQSGADVSIYDIMIDGPKGATPERLETIEKLLSTQSVSWLHRDRFRVCEVNGRVVAGLEALSDVDMDDMSLGRAFMEIGWSLEEVRAMALRMEPCMRVEPKPPEGTWVIENVGCHEESRRQGHVSAILEAAFDEGRDLGYGVVQLGCVIGNTPAQKAYERAGFKVMDEFLDDEFEELTGRPGMYRMVRELQENPSEPAVALLTPPESRPCTRLFDD